MEKTIEEKIEALELRHQVLCTFAARLAAQLVRQDRLKKEHVDEVIASFQYVPDDDAPQQAAAAERVAFGFAISFLQHEFQQNL